MNGKWIQIFKGGKQTDSAGNAHDGDQLIDQAVASFNAEAHEPPVVVGHPKDNAPAFGWVSELRKVGDVLEAKLKDVADDFTALVEKGRFKKRSASFYPDGRLRHVGFLGAMPPAVKGLEDVAFNEDDQAIEFEENLGTAQDKDPEPNGGKGKNEGAANAQEVTIMEFTEEQLQEIKDQAKAEGKAEGVAEGKEEAQADFAEQQREEKAKQVKADAADFCEKGVAEGKLAPAWVKAGLADFIGNLDFEETADFGEGDDKAKTPHQWFMEFLQGLPKLVDMKEFAEPKNEGTQALTRAQFEALNSADKAAHLNAGGAIKD